MNEALRYNWILKTEDWKMNDENPATIVTGFSLVGEGCAKLFRNALPRLLRCVHSHRFICALAENSPPDCFLIACLRIHLLPFCCGKKLRNTLKGVPKFWWEKVDSNHRSMTQQIYSLPPLATREFSHILFLELVDGLEPPTCWLQISCSTNWATPAFFKCLFNIPQTDRFVNTFFTNSV